MIKRVVLSGYYGFDNLGDEAVLQSIIQALQFEEPNLEIMVLSNDPENTEKRYGVRAQSRWQLAEVFRALKKTDFLISGGGSLLQDTTSQMTIPYYLGIVALARLLGKKVAFYAQGVGPISGGLGKILTRIIANRVQLITVRDQDSLDLLKSLGVKRPELRVTVDPVVLLNPEKSEKSGMRKIHELKEKCHTMGHPLIGIAPRPWQNNQRYQDELIKTARRLAEEKQAKILLIPMHAELDLPFCQEMAEKLSGAMVLKEQLLPAELLAVYQMLDFLIGIRLHSLIFAAVVNLPHVGISYDPKIDSFLARLGDQAVVNIENINSERLAQEVVTRLGEQQQQVARIEKHISILKNEARENAHMVLNC